VPESDDPNKLIKIRKERVGFDTIIKMVLSEAKEDGCLFIPFEETSKASMEVGKVPDLLQKKLSYSKVHLLDDKFGDGKV
jgi:hypothetical protein